MKEKLMCYVMLYVDDNNGAVMSDLRHYLVRFGIIKAAHAVLPRQELLRQILMSSAGSVQPSDSCTDIDAAAARIDTASATDTQLQVGEFLQRVSSILSAVCREEDWLSMSLIVCQL